MMEDFSIYHLLFHKAKTFFYIRKPLYYYRIINNSLSQKKKDGLSIYNISLRRNEFFRINYPEMKEKYRIVPLLSASCLDIDLKLININPQFYIRKYLFFLITRKYFSLNKKIQFILMSISTILLKEIRSFYEKD
jgi:hypothetical protein